MKVGDLPITIILREKSEQHVRSHNFRGYRVRCAGNFFRWDTLDAFLEDQEFLFALQEDVEEAVRENHSQRTFEYDFDAHVGWSSTVHLSRVNEDYLEPFNLNRNAYGMRVKSVHQDIKAPLTRTITVTYELKPEIDRGTQREQLSVVIFSVHPGEDIGPLKGNMSKPRKGFRGCNFFDWDHPGE
jgi:hypothetical protein